MPWRCYNFLPFFCSSPSHCPSQLLVPLSWLTPHCHPVITSLPPHCHSDTSSPPLLCHPDTLSSPPPPIVTTLTPCLPPPVLVVTSSVSQPHLHLASSLPSLVFISSLFHLDFWSIPLSYNLLVLPLIPISTCSYLWPHVTPKVPSFIIILVFQTCTSQFPYSL